MALSFDTPPIYDPIVDEKGRLKESWQGWFATFYNTMIGYLTQNGIQLPVLKEEDERDKILNPTNGLMIFNKKTNEPQIYINGSWRNITHS
jgi:hypothetical protein